MQEYIIGRGGDQPFKITAEGVSDKHACITIDDLGNWQLQDLKGPEGNGTFIKNGDGLFVRVSKCKITERTIIRLADAGHNSCTFMAHHVLVAPNDFSFEFDLLNEMARDYDNRLEKLDDTLRIHSKISIIAPIAALLFTCLPLPIFSSNPILARVIITASSSLVNAFFAGDKNKPKQLQALRSRMLVCPSCGRPLSDFDIKNRRCSACKAQ